jgi:uncharacterized protein with PQ loop repeat
MNTVWIEILAWLSNGAFSIAAIPQLYKTVKDGHADGLTWSFLCLWLLGESGSAVCLVNKHMPAFLCSYILNIFFILVILLYKIFPRKKKPTT